MTFDEKMKALQALADQLFPVGGGEALTFFATKEMGDGTMRNFYHAHNTTRGGEYETALNITACLLEQHVDTCDNCRAATGGKLVRGHEGFLEAHFAFLEAVAAEAISNDVYRGETPSVTTH